MRHAQYFYTALLILIISTFSSCEIIGGIFKAGMGVGIFIVVALIAVIALVIGRMGKR